MGMYNSLWLVLLKLLAATRLTMCVLFPSGSCEGRYKISYWDARIEVSQDLRITS
jgi:hypothetical protein